MWKCTFGLRVAIGPHVALCVLNLINAQERLMKRGKSSRRKDDNEETAVKRFKTCALGHEIQLPLSP